MTEQFYGGVEDHPLNAFLDENGNVDWFSQVPPSLLKKMRLDGDIEVFDPARHGDVHVLDATPEQLESGGALNVAGVFGGLPVRLTAQGAGKAALMSVMAAMMADMMGARFIAEAMNHAAQKHGELFLLSLTMEADDDDAEAV